MINDAMNEQFFTTLISGNRAASRHIIQEALNSGASPQEVYDQLFWTTLEHVERLYRNDQLSELAHHYATRLMRSLIDQIQLQLKQTKRCGKRVLLVCGPEELEELGAQMACDLLEASGYDLFFAGGGIANDEVVNQLGEMQADILVIFGAVPKTVPMTRLLIDHLHAIGVCPKLQIAVGGGVFNRADGLAEEIGADLWAKSPQELVDVVTDKPQRRMSPSQRTVGGKRRVNRVVA